MKNLIKIAFWKNIQVAVLLSVLFSYAQSGGRLYLSSAGTGRIYDITGTEKNTVATGLSVIAIPTYYNQTRGSAVSNLAVGYDSQDTNRPIVFMNSDRPAGSSLQKNGVAANTLPNQEIGGLGTNNVLGGSFGNVYALQVSGKNIYQVYPTVSTAAITITAAPGDTIWGSANTTIFASDIIFDYQNNIYVIVENVNGTTYTRYLYQIKIAAGGTAAVATQYKQITGPVGIRNATTGTNTQTNVGNIRGVAYLNGNAFVVGGNGANDVLAYRIDMNTGASTYLRTYTATGIGNTNMDLASVDYFQPFEFDCGNIAFQGTSNYVVGTSSIRTVRMPIKNIYSPGTYTINVSGTDITTSSYNAVVETGTGYLDVPVTYNGAGSSGSRTVTLSLNGSTTVCTVLAPIAINASVDSDGDGVPDSSDLDSDNDGILNSVEMYCDQTNIPNGTWPISNNPPTTPILTKQLLFFDWSGVTLNNTNKTATKSITFNGITYTATISNFAGVAGSNLVGSDILTYPSGPSQMISKYYNVNGDTFKEVLYTTNYFTGTNKLDVTITATKDNVAFPINVIVFDPETTNNDPNYKEELSYTTNGSAFALVEKTGSSASLIGNNISGIDGKKITYLNTEKTPLINALFQTSGFGVTINASMLGSNTKQGFGFAVRLYCDTDNDGNPNYLDLDSDGDGCPDAGEGGGKFDVTSLVTASGSLAAQNPNKNFGTSVDANGIPTRVGASGQTKGASQNAAINGCFCYNDPNTTGTGLDTQHGITLLKRAGADNGNWPMVRKGAHTALESNTKGFVITRLATTELSNISAPVDGMMVYDTTVDCLKIYTVDATPANTGWKCFNTPTCP